MKTNQNANFNFWTRVKDGSGSPQRSEDYSEQPDSGDLWKPVARPKKAESRKLIPQKQPIASQKKSPTFL